MSIIIAVTEKTFCIKGDGQPKSYLTWTEAEKLYEELCPYFGMSGGGHGGDAVVVGGGIAMGGRGGASER